jgi:hypothetical protein
MMKFKLTFVLICFSLIAQAQDWKPMFNGKDLSGWEIRGGEAIYAIEGNTVIGTTKGRLNTFLSSKQEYGDFILELELLVDPSMNSGIQIRSHEGERVFGYQIEIDPEERAWSGGFYDEGRRGWLYPVSLNPKGRKAFKNGVWNSYRIEAIGNSFRIWVNGICTSATLDDMDATGFIGLQVHGIGPKKTPGTQIKWRNIRIMTEDLEAHRTPIPNNMYELNLLGSGLTEMEKRKGFRMLWDGASSKGWRQVHGDKFPDKKWTMANGELVVGASTGEGSGDGQDIITEEEFENFELTLQYKITEGANSGIKYFVDESVNPNGGAIGLEFQVLDNKAHPDAQNGVNGNRKQGALYDLIPTENLSWGPTGQQYNKPVGRWNHVRIISKNGHVEHWLNGFKVVEYDRFSQVFRTLVSRSKYKDWENFGQGKTGHIVLQDHGNKVSYRSIKIREF